MAIIAISRQVGSLGDEIAALVARNLDHQFIDQAHVHTLAQSCDPEFSKTCKLFETELQTGFSERFFFHNPASTSLFESLNYGLAGRGRVVIIGRGAQIVFRRIPDIFKARIMAPLEVRVKRIAEQRNVPLEEAGEFVQKYDKQRRALMRSLFDKDLRDWNLYNLIVNTACYTAEAGADIICAAATRMARASEEESLQELLKNMALAKQVESAIKRKILTSPYRNIEVTSISKGILTLSGYVQDRWTKEQAERIALGLEGVTRVENNLKTTELSF